MAPDPETGYVVLREVTLESLQGEVIADAEMRIFVTDGKIISEGSADKAVRTLIEEHVQDVGKDLEGVYATCPARSWDPGEYEIDMRPVARRKRTSSTPMKPS